MKQFTTILFCLFLSILLTACQAGERQQSKDQIRLAELSATHEQLKLRYREAQERLEALEDPSSNLNFLEAQVIREQVEFVEGGDTAQDVRDRGFLRCGGNADVPGFGFLDPNQGRFVGFDIDICRAIAAAVLGPDGSENIDITPLTSRLRFAALQSAEIDVLIRNTTHTLTRDTNLRLNFAPVTFYDGQGIMVRANSGIKRLSDISGKAICVQTASTSAANLASYYANLGLPLEIIEFADRVAARDQYEQGTCDGFTGDKSSLLAQRTLLEAPEEHIILAEDISREPLAPVVRHEDDNWHDVVTWSVQCLFNGELLGVTQENVDEMRLSEDAAIRQLLGVEGELGEQFGLSNHFCYEIIRQVGNYADIYDRHLGPQTQFNLPRSLNRLYLDGGVIYPIPFK